MSHPSVSLNPAVKDALDKGAAVVALESTIITHGMPYPANRDTALEVEQAVMDAGATPATIAVVGGVPTVGLSHDQIEALAKGRDAMKLSRADLAMAIARKVDGSTTVAATMILAHMAGIAVFATGGIGGVHQGAERSFDVSADLQELARTPVCVVSAGAKAILDIPKTLEVLETLGVPVLAFGQDNFPAFWSRDSGLPSPLRVNSAQEIATFIKARELINLEGGVLIGNPVPEDAEVPRSIMDNYIQRAVIDAAREGVQGKHVTPWLLSRIVELSGGASLATNKALIVNNATLAGRIAVECCGQ